MFQNPTEVTGVGSLTHLAIPVAYRAIQNGFDALWVAKTPSALRLLGS